MIEHGVCMVIERKGGFLSFGLDRLGGEEGGGLLLYSLHPYGFRSQPRPAEKREDGEAGEGAGLLSFNLGGGDEGAIPTQDPRVELPDEGKGGSILYAWTGSAVSSIVVSGDDGKVRVTAPETIIGEDAQAKELATKALVDWINSTLIPKLAEAPGGPITVTPPSGVLTTATRAQ